MALPLIAGAVTRKAVAGRAASVGASNAKQSSQVKSQFQKTSMDLRRAKSIPQAANSDEEQETDDGQSNVLGFPQATGSPRSQFMQMNALARRGQAANDNQEKSAAAATQTQEVAKGFVKSGRLRGIFFLTNGVSGPLEAGSGGIGLIATFIPRLISLGWLNIEMIYGTWIKKGKHPIIPAISWKPLKIPIDKKARFLQLIIIMTDILLLFVVFLVVLGPAIFITWLIS